MRKAAKFRCQVAAEVLVETPVVPAAPENLPPVGPLRAHRPPSGRRALELAMRKAAKFRCQVAEEMPAATESVFTPADPPAFVSTATVVADAVLLPDDIALPVPTPHPTRARKALSSPRGQRALELAMRKAAEARAASTPPPSPPLPVPPPAVVSTPEGSTPHHRRIVPRLAHLRHRTPRWAALSLAASVVGLAVGVFLFLHSRAARLESTPLAKSRPSLAWLHQAQERAADGSFRLALDTVDRALADSPSNAALLKFKGDMHQSLFEFEHARVAYEEALRIDPQSRWAHENLVLSRRLERGGSRFVGKRSDLYGLHRAMMAQGRLDEALAISGRLRMDSELVRKTWQAALDRTGLQGRVTVDGQGVLSLDLSGDAQPDLTLIHKFPVRRLNLACTGVEDLRPLAGMPLDVLDLSHTPVYDLAPLRGMPLEVLRASHTGVVDLTPLAGCPLRELDISGTRVAGLEPLAGMPLASLQADGTPLTDLRPLAALPLTSLSLSGTRVADLTPLCHLGLEVLNLGGTSVVDLSPLAGSPLRELSLADTPVNDLTPLAGAPLTILTLRGCRFVRDLRPLASCTELEHLSVPPGYEHLEALKGLPHLRFVEGGRDTQDRLARVRR